MRKVRKILLWTLGGLFGLIVLLAAYNALAPLPVHAVQAPPLKLAPDSLQLARGEHLVALSCINCHRGPEGQLDGAFFADSPFGTIHAPNLTQHPEKGIARYTDGELLYLLRTGVKRNGQLALPMMPRYAHLSDADLQSIIAYLRSDARAVQPSDRDWPALQGTFLYRALMRVAFQPLPFPEAPVAAPPVSDQVAYGRYLATGALECYGCHAASFETVNVLEPEKSEGFFGGGNVFADPVTGEEVLSANLTMHPEAGIGRWTPEQFAEAVRFGRRPDGTSLSPTMPKFTVLTDEEAAAIWAYLQTVPHKGVRSEE